MSFQLFTLGSLSLREGDREIVIPVQRGVQAALIAYLAVERAVTRQQVIGVFWPETDEEKARHALSQALHQLRQTLGDDCLLIDGDRIQVLSSMQVDAENFERAVEAEAFDVALGLYRAPFLAGVDNQPNTKAFESWVDARRAHYEQLRRRAQAVAGDPRPLHAFLNELKRRHVLSTTGGYLVVSWILVQVSATTFPMLRLPTWAPTLVLVLALLGLPVTVFFSWVFDITPEGIRRTPSLRSPRPGIRGRVQRVAALSASSLVVLVTSWLVLAGLASRPDPLDSRVVAVMPFRAIGADATITDLAAGMDVLLATRLNSETGLRASDPQSVFGKLTELLGADFKAISDEASLSTARHLKAGRVLRGTVIGALGRVTFTASLVDTNNGERVGSATVEGPLDSFTALVDQLAVRLLGLEAGESEDRLTTLTSTSVQAVQAYLAGEARFRRGIPNKAVAHYERALQHDSTFALAAYRLTQALGWADQLRTPDNTARAARLACANQDRLSPRDRLRLEAAVCVRGRSLKEQLEFLDRAVANASDDPQLWLLLGDRFFHVGALTGTLDWRARSISAFERALELGHPYPFEAEQHLLEMFAAAQDTAALGRIVQRNAELSENDDEFIGAKWMIAAAFDDTAKLRKVRAQFNKIGLGGASQIASVAQGAGFYIEDAERLLQNRRVTSQMERDRLFNSLRMLSLNLGRPSMLAAAERDLLPGISPPTRGLLERVVEALYWNGDAAVAGETIRQLKPLALRPPRDSAEQAQQRRARCALTLWNLSRGDLESARPMVAEMDTARGFCAHSARAILKQQVGAPDARAANDSLDALMSRNVGFSREPIPLYANLISARLHEQRGEFREALAAVRRRQYAGNPPLLLSTFLREEGRLATLTGDTTAAIRAYQHYLALRYNPDPHLKPEAERVRLALARLQRPQR